MYTYQGSAQFRICLIFAHELNRQVHTKHKLLLDRLLCALGNNSMCPRVVCSDEYQKGMGVIFISPQKDFRPQHESQIFCTLPLLAAYK